MNTKKHRPSEDRRERNGQTGGKKLMENYNCVAFGGMKWWVEAKTTVDMLAVARAAATNQKNRFNLLILNVAAWEWCRVWVVAVVWSRGCIKIFWPSKTCWLKPKVKNNRSSGKWQMKEKLVLLPQQRQKSQNDEGERRRNTLRQFDLSLPRGQRGDGGGRQWKKKARRSRRRKRCSGF